MFVLMDWLFLLSSKCSALDIRKANNVVRWAEGPTRRQSNFRQLLLPCGGGLDTTLVHAKQHRQQQLKHLLSDWLAGLHISARICIYWQTGTTKRRRGTTEEVKVFQQPALEFRIYFLSLSLFAGWNERRRCRRLVILIFCLHVPLSLPLRSPEDGKTFPFTLSN